MLLIFDVDGTLCNTFGLGRRAFELAFEDVYKIANAAEGIRPHGRTDMWIFKQILINHNQPVEDFQNHYQKFISLYLRYLKDEILNWKVCRLLPGVDKLLECLHHEPNAYLALGTGNEKEAAYIKLNKLNVGQYFQTGGFGSDSIDRAEILRIAKQRACKHYDIEFSSEHVWVIGDTPLDIENGRKMGANTLAVATGGIDIDELKQHNSSALVEDLSDLDEFLNIVGLPNRVHV